jgi:NTP pyrophosphatase (non-canonical NTP hydrolase)
MEPDETQESIHKWAVNTFGNVIKQSTYAIRMNLEVAELLQKLDQGKWPAAREECADVFIVLCCVASQLGIDLQDEVNRKMEINRNRKWKLHGDGTAQHI